MVCPDAGLSRRRLRQRPDTVGGREQIPCLASVAREPDRAVAEPGDNRVRLGAGECVRQLAEFVADGDPAAARPAVDAGVRVAGVRLRERRRGRIPAVRIGGIDRDRHHVSAVETLPDRRPGRAAVVAP